MTKKKHPSNRYERLKLNERVKFGKNSKDRAGYVRHEREEAAVRELEYALRREPIYQEQ